MEDNTRRTLLKALTTLPIIGASVLAMHALLRYFRPTLAGGVKALMAPPMKLPVRLRWRQPSTILQSLGTLKNLSMCVPALSTVLIKLKAPKSPALWSAFLTQFRALIPKILKPGLWLFSAFVPTWDVLLISFLIERSYLEAIILPLRILSTPTLRVHVIYPFMIQRVPKKFPGPLKE